MATLLVPTPLRRLTGGQSKIEIEGETVGAILQVAEEKYPGISAKVLDESGSVKRFINVFLNEDEIGELKGLETPVTANDRVSIVPAMAGGNFQNE
ncbi:MAG: MoaD/ThiS family protein [Chloroflexota bacterium]